MIAAIKWERSNPRIWTSYHFPGWKIRKGFGSSYTLTENDTFVGEFQTLRDAKERAQDTVLQARAAKLAAVRKGVTS